MKKYIAALVLNLAFVSEAFAMTGQPGGSGGQPGGGNIFSLLLPMVIVFAIFYLLLIRPQQKQQKKFKAMIDSMQRGDEVVTRGGINGKIAGIADNVITVEIADNVKIKVSKEYISVVKGKEEPRGTGKK